MFKINLFKGDPIFVEDEEAKEILTAWASGIPKIIIKGEGYANGNIASITRDIGDPLYFSKPLNRLERPKKTSEEIQETKDLWDKCTKELATKFNWKKTLEKLEKKN